MSSDDPSVPTYEELGDQDAVDVSSIVKDLVGWLSVTKSVDEDSTLPEDELTTGIRWGKLAVLSFGSWIVAGAVSIADILGGFGSALLLLTDAFGSFYGDLYGAYLSVVESFFSFGAAVAWLEPLGIGAGPLGIGIALLALYLWVTIE